MEHKQQINKWLHLQIKPAITYKESVTWKDIQNIVGILPDDVIDSIIYMERTGGGGFGFGSEDDTFYFPVLRVSRLVLESDEEYTKRMKEKAVAQKAFEDKEHLEYLRLKAKFE
jgi:hypothetical protein